MSQATVKKQLRLWVNQLEIDFNEKLEIIRSYIDMIKVEEEAE